MYLPVIFLTLNSTVNRLCARSARVPVLEMKHVLDGLATKVVAEGVR
jgi:hypothetical protein